MTILPPYWDRAASHDKVRRPPPPRKRPRPMRGFLIVVAFVVGATVLTILPVLIAFLLRWLVSIWRG